MRLFSFKTNFGGQIIDEHGITLIPEKVTAMQQFPWTNTSRQPWRFIGLINYYLRFIPGCAQVLTPVTNLLQKQKNKNEKITLEGDSLTAFHGTKKALTDLTKRSYIREEEINTNVDDRHFFEFYRISNSLSLKRHTQTDFLFLHKTK